MDAARHPLARDGSGHVRVAIIGSGFGGLGAAIRLRRAGIDDLVVFERGMDVGGTWRVNRYPGAACDIPSRLYEFTFAPNPDWSRRFAGQAEILAYLRACADRFDVRRHVRFGHDVRHAAWDDAGACWRITTSRGACTANVLIVAAGVLTEPRLPDVPGLDGFAGRVVHTSTWDDTVDVRGRRVAVVGTGASAVQVVPAIQPVVDHLVVFQRTPPWVLPRGDRPLSRRMRTLACRAPVLHRLMRAALYAGREVGGLPFRHPWMARSAEALAGRHLGRQVPDPDLRAVLTPHYRIGCKRVLLSDDWYPALGRDNVSLVDGALARVRGRLVHGVDGSVHDIDLLVVATGFRPTEPSYARWIHGRHGATLSDAWTPTMRSHLGTTVAGFPNLFVLLGPNTGLGHNSVVRMIEAQIDHLVNAIATMDAHGAVAVEPYHEAQTAFVAEVEDAMVGTVWTSGGCDSWYLDAAGRNTTLWPGSVGAFRRRVAPFDPSEYLLHGGDQDLSHVRPTALERVSGAVGRRILRRTPSAVAAAVAGGSDLVDGVRFDPASQLVIAARGPGTRSLTAGTPAQARVRNRREVLSGTGRPTAVRAVEELTVDGATGPLRARLYRPATASGMPLLLYAHGGGFVLGDLDTHDEPCRRLCSGAGQAVLSVAYRLAPEHPFPAAIDDVVAALRWSQCRSRRLGAGGRVAVGGDSAGATLAAVAARRTAAHEPAAAQLLIYPATDRVRQWPSQERFDGWFLTRSDVARFSVWYGGADSDPGVSPLRATDLSGLPPAYTVTAGFDVLRDEGRAYAGALAAAGTASVLDHAPALGHGFLHLTQVSPAADRAVSTLVRRWRQLLRKACVHADRPH